MIDKFINPEKLHSPFSIFARWKQKLFCGHEFELLETDFKSIYVLIFCHSHNVYYYIFKCKKCGKLKKIQVSFEEYHKRNNWLLNKLKNSGNEFNNRF